MDSVDSVQKNSISGAEDAAQQAGAGAGASEEAASSLKRGEKRGKRITGLAAALLIAALAAGIGAYASSDAVRFENAVEAGTEYVGLQQYELAIEAFQEALSIEEDDLTTRMLLLESYAGAGDYDTLGEVLAESVTVLTLEDYTLLEEAAAGLYEEGAETSLAAGDVDGAVSLYEKVLELTEEESEAAGNATVQLAELYLEQAMQTSLDLFAAVLEKDPDNAAALEMTAKIYDSLGSYEEAIEYYERLLEAGGDPEDIAQDIARCWKGIASQRTGSSAVAAWQEVLNWDPYSEEAYLSLVQIYLDEEDTQSAFAVLESGLALIESEELQTWYDELYVSDFEQLVIEIIESITTEDMTQDEKRLACYEYIIETTSYVRTYESPEGDWTKEYAYDVLALQQGNCFRYAAAFAYMCRELGYEVKVCTGEVSARAGGTTPHGWVVLTIDGVEYLCDPDLEQSLGYDFYMKTYDEYPVKPLITEEEWEIEF